MNGERFVFGTQYLRGMTPRREDWAGDMAAMRGLGFNTVRAWLVWGVLEPSEGKIDFDYVEQFLDLSLKHSLRVGLLFHLHGCPEWAVRKHSRFWYVDEEGRSFEPSARSNTPSGGWPGLCPDNPEVQVLEASFIRAIASRFGEHPALDFWEPVNEPHQWLDPMKSPPMSYCYCAATRIAFIQWLKGKYATLEALEDAWGRRFSRWDDVRPPTWRMLGSDWTEWRNFTTDSVAGLVRRRADIIRRCSSRPVIGHAYGGGSVTCGHLGAMAFDDWKNAASLDQWGYSAFPGNLEGTSLIGLGTDATRAASNGKVFWQSELGTGDYGAGFDRQGRLRPELLSIWSWESLRHGVKGLLYWQYRKEAHGAESGVYGLTDYAGGPTASTEAVAKIGRILAENAPLFMGSAPVRAQVALLFSFQSYLMEWSQRRNCQLCVDSVSGYYRMLWEANIPVDVVHEDFADAAVLGRYKVLVAPMPIALSDSVRSALKDYVAAGGTLLSDPYFCAYDPFKRLDCRVPGAGFDEVFGCDEDDILHFPGTIGLRRGSREGSVDKGHFMEFFKLRPGSEALAVYADGRPCVVSNRYGSGLGLISGINLGLAYSQCLSLADDLRRDQTAGADSFVKELVLEILSGAGVEAPLRASAGVVASVLTGPAGVDILVAINTTDACKEATIELPTSTYSDAFDLDGGKSVQFRSGVLRPVLKPLESRAFGLSAKRAATDTSKAVE